MPTKNVRTPVRPTSPSEYDSEDLEEFFSSACKEVYFYGGPGKEPKTPPLVTVEEPDISVPPLALPPTTTRLALPPIPRKDPVPRVSKKASPIRKVVPGREGNIKKKSKAPPVLPDAAAIVIRRTAEHQALKKKRAKQRPRMNKKPSSSPFHCKICLVTCTGRAQYYNHLHSKGHQKKSSNEKFECKVCGTTATSQVDLENHILGRLHRQKVRGF